MGGRLRFLLEHDGSLQTRAARITREATRTETLFRRLSEAAAATMTPKSTGSILSEKGAEAVETEEVHEATKKHSNDDDANGTTIEGDLTRSQRKQAALALAKPGDFLCADDDIDVYVSDPAVHHNNHHNNNNSEENNEKQTSKDENDDRMEKGFGKTPPPLRRSRDVSGPRSTSRPGAFAQPGIHSGSGHSGEDRSVATDVLSAGATAPPQQQQHPNENEDDDEEVPSQDILIMATLVEDPPPLASQITQATAVTLDESERIEDESGATSPSVRSVLKNHMVAEEKQDRRLLIRLVVVVGVLAVAGFVVLLVLLLKGDSGSSSDNRGNGSNNLASPPTSSSTEDAATNPAWFAQQDHVSFHAVQYRADIPTHCDSVTPAAELSLSCERESFSSSSTTTRMPSVLVVNSGSANVLCERHNDNWISCRVASDVLDPEWILLAACGEAQDQGDNDDTVLTLRAGLSQRELTGCGDVTEETTAGTATTKVYASEAFQSLAVGQFCFDQDDDENASGEEDDGMKFMMETNSCLQGHEQAMDNSNSLICVASNSCQSEWTCLENGSDCSGSSHCDYTLGPVEAKDPRMGCSSMMEAKDDNGNFDFDEAGMMEMAGNKMERRRTRWQRI